LLRNFIFENKTEEDVQSMAYVNTPRQLSFVHFKLCKVLTTKHRTIQYSLTSLLYTESSVTRSYNSDATCSWG